jgi:serine/threonine protein kinase
MESEGTPRITPAAWARISAVFTEVHESPLAERPSRLAGLCGDDEAIRTEVESLLEADRVAGDFADGPSHHLCELVAGVIDPLPYQRLGPWELLELIGQGGMGTVYRARRADDEFRREVAIKVVSRGMNTDFVLRRFRTERQILADLAHPNITTLLDGGTTPDDLPYLVMEFVSGEPVSGHCESRSLDLRARVELIRTVCLAVGYAHERHIVHRDLKPSNILVNGNGSPKVLDFGIARILKPENEAESATTMGAQRLLTPQYASPEQFTGRPVSAAADVYSMGIVLRELIADTRNPWARSIDRGLQAVLQKATREEPDDRYPNATEFADDLGRWLRGETVRALRGATLYRMRCSLARNWRRAAAVAFVLAAGGAIWYGLRTPSAPPKIAPLTRLPGLEIYPNLSPDARQVVFSWNRTPEGQFDLYTQPISGGDPVRLTSDPHDEIGAVWSPDGRRIAFLRRHDARGLATVHVLSPGGGPERSLMDVYLNDHEEYDAEFGGFLAWHPSQPWMVVACEYGDDRGLWLVHTTSGEKRRLTSGRDVAPAFSPSGGELAFVRKSVGYAGEIYRIVLNRDLTPAGAPEVLTSQGEHNGSPVWHPGGKWLFYLHSLYSGDNSLFRVQPSRPGAVELLEQFNQPTLQLSNAVRDSDGSIRMSAVRGNDNSNVWLVRDPPDREPAPAPPFINSTREEFAAQFSPDGSHIALQSNRTGAAELWTFRSDGTDPRQLTHFGGAFIGGAEWTPDGKHVVTHARTDLGVQIFDIPADGGPARRLTDEMPGFMHPSVSRDGRSIYMRGALFGGALYRMPWTGGLAEELSPDATVMAVESFDGQSLYYTRNEAGNYSLWQIPVRGGVHRKVLDGLADQSAFRPVEDGIYIVARGRLPAIQFYDFRTRKIRNVTKLAKSYAWGLDVYPLTSGSPRTLLVILSDLMEMDLIRLENLR